MTDPTGTITTSSTANYPCTESETSKPSSPPSSNKVGSTSTTTTTKTSPPTYSPKPGNSAPATNPATSPSAPGHAPHSNAASSTGNDNATAAPPGNSQATHTNGHGPSSSASSLTTLSPRLNGILLEIEMPVTWYGYSEKEVATKLGVPTSVVRACRTELHNHLAEQQR